MMCIERILFFGIMFGTANCATTYRVCKSSNSSIDFECTYSSSDPYFKKRYTETMDNCIIDIRDENNYVILIDEKCDGSVNHLFNKSETLERSSFGNKYDKLFNDTREEIGALVSYEYSGQGL